MNQTGQRYMDTEFDIRKDIGYPGKYPTVVRPDANFKLGGNRISSQISNRLSRPET